MENEYLENEFGVHQLRLHSKNREITKEDLRVIAPYLWVKQKPEKKNSSKPIFDRMPSMLLKDLSLYISDTVNIHNLLYETATILKSITDSMGSLIYMVDTVTNEIVLCPKPEEEASQRVAWNIAPGGTIAAYVAYKKEFTMVNGILVDERYPEGVGWKGLTVTSVLCIPIVTPDRECFAVIEFFRKNGVKYEYKDLEIVVAVTGWMGAAIHQNQQRIKLEKLQNLNNYLLDLTEQYFSNTILKENMISEIVKFAKETINAERGSFFVLDQESDKYVAEVFDEGFLKEDSVMLQKKKLKIRFHIERGIASLAANSGQLINIKNAHEDPRFDKLIDKKTGVITRSILCMPITGKDKKVVGVVQLLNKKNGFFTALDEDLFKIFASYCSIILSNTRLISNIQKTKNYNDVYLNMLCYQINRKVTDMELVKPVEDFTPPDGFAEFDWYPYPDHMNDLLLLSNYMFKDICGESLPKDDKLFNFLLNAMRCYRPVPYHNFEHAFNVLHSIYNMLKRTEGLFSSDEQYAFMVAITCHDLDHQGFTNNYLQVTKNPIAQLYEESMLENHHVWVATHLIEENNMFEKYSSENYTNMIKLMSSLIISTDITLHLRQRFKISTILMEGNFDWNNELHRGYLRSIMMTSADLSGQAKPYTIGRRLAENIYREFYHQGDLEKEMGFNPLTMMDRERIRFIPEYQVQFLNFVCLPCFEMLGTLIPETYEIFKLAKSLKDTWNELVAIRNQKVWNQDKSYDNDIKPTN